MLFDEKTRIFSQFRNYRRVIANFTCRGKLDIRRIIEVKSGQNLASCLKIMWLLQ